MIAIEVHADTANLQTGRWCLEFANTAEWHASDQPDEHLQTYTDLVYWSQQVGILSNLETQPLFQEAARRPAAAAAVLEQAITLREAIYRIFSAVAASQPPQTADLAILNAALAEALGRLKIVHTANHFTWGWVGDGDSLDQMLWPVAQSAADLLTSDELDRVGECADDRGCGYLFLDKSRNHSRRWCDMKDCGNRAKVRRFRRSHPTAEVSGSGPAAPLQYQTDQPQPAQN